MIFLLRCDGTSVVHQVRNPLVVGLAASVIGLAGCSAPDTAGSSPGSAALIPSPAGAMPSGSASRSIVRPPSIATDHGRWIAYQTDRGGTEGIWLIHPDGSGDHEIGGEGAHLHPAWAPDGQQLVFTTRDMSTDTDTLWIWDARSDATRQLTNCQCPGDDNAAFDPSGERIVFGRALGPLDADGLPADCGIWILEIDSDEEREVAPSEGCNPAPSTPRWSSDGTQVVYERERFGDAGTGTSIWVLDPEDGSQMQITPWEQFGSSPDWAPDGEWIVFNTYNLGVFQCCQVSNLYRIHPDGSGLEELTSYTDAKLRATQPKYTPDGEWIVYTQVTPDNRQIAIMPAAGGDAYVLSPEGIFTHPAWQP